MIRCTPKQGDVVELDCSPDQMMRRGIKHPAMIVSCDRYYRETGLLVVCSVGSIELDSPTHYRLSKKLEIPWTVYAERIMTIDPQVTPILYIETARKSLIERVTKTVGSFFRDDD